MRPAQRGVSIVGPGRLGQALGKLLASAGVPVLYVAGRRLKAARAGVHFIGRGEPTCLDDYRLAEASVIVLTTADSAYTEVAQRLATLRRNWSGKVVLHTCGSLPSSVLRPLKRRGAAIGSLHPFQTIPNPTAGVRNLKGCFWAVEGDAPAVAVAKRWVKAFGGTAFRVRPTRKTLYHAAAFLVSPTLVTLMNQSVRFLRLSGVPARFAWPMLGQFVSETVRNFMNLRGRRALTGPAVRGDWTTIQRHIRALKRTCPEFLPVYREMLRAMLRLSGRRMPRFLEDALQ